MTNKEKILALLEKNRGKPISGESIAKTFDISREAVRKSINSLKSDGHSISAVSNLGYTLSMDSDILSAAGIAPYLSDENWAANIYVFNSVDSTNNKAKEMAVSGAEHGTVVIAEKQTAGRGRYGRSFHSPSRGGLYFSIILRRERLGISDTTHITASAAVAVCRAVESVVKGVEPRIKWVNDVFLNGKKICGILTEAVTDFESGEIDWIVIGIGINVSTENMPDEVLAVATSVFDGLASVDAVRNRIAAELINIFLSNESGIFKKEIQAEYKSKSMILGQTVTVLGSEEPYEAVAIDIDEDCRLVVKKLDGTIVSLSTGEISVKLCHTERSEVS